MTKNRILFVPLIATLLSIPAIADTTSSSSTNRVIHNDVDEGSGDTSSSSTEVQHMKVNSAEPTVPATTTTTTTSPGAESTTTLQQPGQIATPPPAPQNSYEQTVITEQHRSEGGLTNEAVGINPQFGILAFSDANGNTDSRGVAGLTIDINGLRRLKSEGGRAFFGPSFGILYSHLGTQTSDFFGLSGPNGNDDGTHLLLIPFDIKAGYTFRDIFRPSFHAGATLVYNNTQLVPTGAEVSGSSTSVHPNIGLDFEFGVGRTVSILIRPDWVFSSDTTIFSGTFGLVFPIS